MNWATQTPTRRLVLTTLTLAAAAIAVVIIFCDDGGREHPLLFLLFSCIFAAVAFRVAYQAVDFHIDLVCCLINFDA